jgi:ComF family protein
LDHCAAVFRYETPIQQLISTFKFHGGLAEGRVLGHLLAASMAKHYSGCREHCLLLPVPLHSKRLRQRGFNQAALLARITGRILAMPLSLTMVRRNLDTPSQALLDARQRRQNLRGAFEMLENLQQGNPERIIIIDDVMTTLSTVSALAGTLRDAGVKHIDAWALARAYKVPS